MSTHTAWSNTALTCSKHTIATVVEAETVVMRLLIGIIGPTSTMALMIIAVAHAKDHLLADFNGSVTHLSMECTELFSSEGGRRLSKAVGCLIGVHRIQRPESVTTP